MKSYSDISKRYMKENKKRTVLTIVGIALATTLLFAIGTFLLSFRDSMISKERKNRNYEFKLNDIPGEKVDKIVKNIEIKNSALVDSNIEYTMNDYNILINKYNDEYYKLIYKGELVEGKIPSSDNEIVIDTITKKKLNVKLGDSLIVKDKENNEVNLKIVGIRKVDMYSSGNELDVDGYFSKIEKSKKYMIYINLKSEKKKQEIISEVIKKADIKLEEGMKEDHGLLLYLTGNGGSDAIDSSIKGLSIFIISIIIICTITVIYNSFNMSVIERIRYYGILKAIGATNRQIKRILYKEGFLMSIIAFPIGCIVGFISLKLGIKIFIGDKFMFTDFKVNFYPIIILITAILVIITVFLSLLAPTRKIKKISAVDAMKNRGEIKVGKIKRRKTRVIEKIFGIEGSMAYKNIRRTPMRFIITLLALTISIVLFNVFYSFMDFAKQAVKGEFMNIAFDAQLEKKNRDGFTNEEIDTIKNNVKCNTMYSLYSKEIVTKINKDNLTDYYYKNTVFEDDETLAMGIEYSLKNEGFEVTVANNIEQGREVEKNIIKYDLILLDVTLPDGNGYDFCKEIRKKSDIPIIFLTACDEEVNIVLGLDLGADDYLTKPVRVRELIARINAVLRRRNIKKDNSDKITYKDLTILPLKYEVYKNETKIQLTSIEYKLMLMMIENKGNVLTRKQLLEKLWDVEGNFIEEKTLNVYIKRLREKLGENDSISYIETIRGVGYRWNEDDMQ